MAFGGTNLPGAGAPGMIHSRVIDAGEIGAPGTRNTLPAAYGPSQSGASKMTVSDLTAVRPDHLAAPLARKHMPAFLRFKLEKELRPPRKPQIGAEGARSSSGNGMKGPGSTGI